MAYRTPDRAQEAVTGTSTLTLAGSPRSNFRTLSAAGISSGDYFQGSVVHRSQNQWKSGVWQRSGSNLVLTRLHASSAAGADFTFASGLKDVYVTSLGRSASPRIVTSADSPYLVLPGDFLLVDTSGGAITLNLWATPVDGEPGATIVDSKAYWPTNNCTIDAGDATIERPGLTDVDRLICDVTTALEVFGIGSKFRVR